MHIYKGQLCMFIYPWASSSDVFYKVPHTNVNFLLLLVSSLFVTVISKSWVQARYIVKNERACSDFNRSKPGFLWRHQCILKPFLNYLISETTELLKEAIFFSQRTLWKHPSYVCYTGGQPLCCSEHVAILLCHIIHSFSSFPMFFIG